MRSWAVSGVYPSFSHCACMVAFCPMPAHVLSANSIVVLPPPARPKYTGANRLATTSTRRNSESTSCPNLDCSGGSYCDLAMIPSSSLATHGVEVVYIKAVDVLLVAGVVLDHREDGRGIE